MMDLQQLVDTELELTEEIVNGINGKTIHKHKWTVIAAYPHHVRLMRIDEDGHKLYNSLSVGDLVQLGILKQARRYYG